MSSSKLLEQAIVDAQALRDSAYKSAQAALVEKFAPQIKEAVEKLLEQEEAEDPAGMAGSPEDVLAADIPAGTDFGGAPPDTSDKGFVAGAAKDIPLAATDGEKLCPCPDDEEQVTLELNLADLADQLKIGKEDEEEEDISSQATLAGMQDQPQAAGGAAQLQENLELESIELEEEMDEEVEPGMAATASDQQNEIDGAANVVEELTEVDLDEVLSEFNVAEEAKNKLYAKLSDKEKKIYDSHPGKYIIVTQDGKAVLSMKGQEKDPYWTKGDPLGYDVNEEKVELSPKQKKIAMAHDNPPAGPEGDEKIDAKDLAALRKKGGIEESNHEDWLGDQAPPYGKITAADCNAVANRVAAKNKNIKENKQTEQTKQLLQASAVLLKEVENKDVKIQKLLEENKKFSSIIEEMSDAFKKLEEVNLLNARLFYQNQILKSASLNERQKTHIVEAISKAETVNEAKTVYETLINSVGGPAEKERSPKSLNEAINKNSSFRLPHKQSEQPHDSNKDRWLKLAGIK